MMNIKVRRALVSVFDKTGIIPFARGLSETGAEIVSTGGTARALRDEGLEVREVEDLTGFPEMMDGRVKTLHPRVHAGLLAVRDNPEHMRQAREHDIGMIDLVAVNLYPFEETVRRDPQNLAGIIEMIDIGGPAMLRSASKNFRHVAVVVDPRDYERVLTQIREKGGIAEATRMELAAKAFSHTAAYDALIAEFLRQRSEPAGFPDTLSLTFRKRADLRYGENPHQPAALYSDPLETGPSAARSEQIHGKELSFNNILDLDASWNLVCDFDEPACAIIKHTNPAGAAVATDPAEAFGLALETDPVSAFGGIAAFNRSVTEGAARRLASIFLEAIIAPDFDAGALEILRVKRTLRLMKAGAAARSAGGRDYKRVAGGLLVQGRDHLSEASADAKVRTKRSPTYEEMKALRFAWTVARHVKSNAIVYARGTATAGIGAGQMSRVDAVRFGAQKARASLEGSALASDAFFPFRDGVDEAAKVGVTAIIQPGGSVKDEEVIEAADEHGIAMVFTGRRHFRH